MTKRTFSVPHIYKKFQCKAGDCRRNCCFGWHITFSLNEYFKLLGLECPPDVKQRLDCAMHILPDPTPERYAEFSRTYEGDCRLHRPDGLCMLQRECGEDALTSVCRYYPRSPRTLYGNECALSSSCEGVVELLFDTEEPLQPEEAELEFAYDMPEKINDIISEHHIIVREIFRHILQNRAYTLSERLAACEKIADIMREPFRARNRADIENAVCKCAEIQPEHIKKQASVSAFDDVKYMFERLVKRYPIEEVENKVEACDFEKYEKLCGMFTEKYPKWEIMSEQVLVNHIFYQGFPFSDAKEDVYETFTALCALYAVWKVASVCCFAENGTYEEYVDMTADLFRMAENSNFNLCAVSLLANGRKIERERVLNLCLL